MNLEFEMREELYNTNFCFSRQDLFDKEKNYDYAKKFYAFDCGIGSFCCYAEKENIIKIIEIAKKYNLEELFLNKAFNKNTLLEFKTKNIHEILKNYNLSDNMPVIFWFSRPYYFDNDKMSYVKDYLQL
jgi:hypothetical protein